MVFSDLPTCWSEFLGPETLHALEAKFAPAIQKGEGLPAREAWFYALTLCPPQAVKAVILGQDPYHGAGQAMGLAFSVPRSCLHPPSLRNLFTEYVSDTGYVRPQSGDLTAWGTQGVLLLNRVLSVAPGVAGSHRGLGWEAFTDLVVTQLSDQLPHCVFCLWGRDAQSVKHLIAARHTVLCTPHPSPLSAHRGFFGSRPFSTINAALESHQQLPLQWALTGDLADDLEGHIGQLF